MDGSAIILAMFGTSVESALPSLFNIHRRVIAAFPGTLVRLTFTSPTIRNIWHERGNDPAYRAGHMHIPGEVFSVRDPAGTMRELREAGYARIVVQPVLMTPGDEFRALAGLVDSQAPGNTVLGTPVLAGQAGDPGRASVEELVRALEPDAKHAREKGAALLYMGHGSRDGLTDDAYRQVEQVLRRQYPDVVSVVAMVERGHGPGAALSWLREQGVSRVILKPLMIIAGVHVRKDMVGPPPWGWQAQLEAEGFVVDPVLRGLGELDGFAEIIADHVAAAASAAGFSL